MKTELDFPAEDFDRHYNAGGGLFNVILETDAGIYDRAFAVRGHSTQECFANAMRIPHDFPSLVKGNLVKVTVHAASLLSQPAT